MMPVCGNTKIYDRFVCVYNNDVSVINMINCTQYAIVCGID